MDVPVLLATAVSEPELADRMDTPGACRSTHGPLQGPCECSREAVEVVSTSRPLLYMHVQEPQLFNMLS